MSGINKAIIIGNLGKDPEFKVSQSGVAICNLSVATTRKQKNGEEKTQWHSVTAFNKAAEYCRDYMVKGCKVYVEGEIDYSQYEKDGITRYYTRINAQRVQILNSYGKSENKAQDNNKESAPVSFDDDIPF